MHNGVPYSSLGDETVARAAIVNGNHLPKKDSGSETTDLTTIPPRHSQNSQHQERRVNGILDGYPGFSYTNNAFNQGISAGSDNLINENDLAHLEKSLRDLPAVTDVPSSSTWYASDQQPTDLQMQSSAIEPFSTEMDLSYQGYDSDFRHNSLNWIPLSIYPSPYGPDLEAEFEYLMPSFPEAHNGQEGKTTMSSNLIDSDTRNSLPQMQHTYIGQSGTNTTARQSHGSPSASNDGIRTADIHFHSFQRPSQVHKRKRRKCSVASTAFEQPRHHLIKLHFPSCQDLLDLPVSIPRKLSPKTYDVIQEKFSRLCLQDNFLYRSFNGDSFPRIEAWDVCIQLYFENFHQRFPLIHRATFFAENHWLSTLAVAAIGSTFAEINEAASLREAFQEFLRRATSSVVEDCQNTDSMLVIAQARLLNLIGLSRSESTFLRSLVPRYHVELARSCLELGFLQVIGPGEDTSRETETRLGLDQRWQVWIQEESRRRLGYLIWLIDASMAYLSDSGPICSVDDARAALPSMEHLWAADSAATWNMAFESSTSQPSLCAAMETLYLKKLIDTRLSELSHVLLVQGLYQRTWEIGKHLKQPLSEWVPRAKSRGFLSTPSKDTFWLPSYPLYENWRNSACDCLDILHWHTNSIVAKASGLEHSAVLHLHLARIVLLTPFQEITDLCFALIGRYGVSPRASFYVHDGSYQTQNRAKLPQIHKIVWRWLREDQHKARLAMIHAGSVFWHVRRYSTNSFYEPTAVYLASLVLWAYGSYKAAALSQISTKSDTTGAKDLGGTSTPTAAGDDQTGEKATRPIDEPTMSTISSLPETAEPDNENDDIESEVDYPQFIHLDRPCDDEMVQHFVRNGHNMFGHMSNIGDICAAPHKLVQEGAKLLKTRLSHWGISREYYDTLLQVAELRKQ